MTPQSLGDVEGGEWHPEGLLGFRCTLFSATLFSTTFLTYSTVYFSSDSAKMCVENIPILPLFRLAFHLHGLNPQKSTKG